MHPRCDRLPFVLCGLVLLAGCERTAPQAPPPLSVDVIALRPAAFRQEVVTISTLDAVEAVQLAAQAGGRIQRLNVRQGDRVRPGQLLVVLGSQSQLSAFAAVLGKAVVDVGEMTA